MAKIEELEQKLNVVLETIKDVSEEIEQYKNENEFNKGVAFAYKCILNLLKAAIKGEEK